MKLFLFSFKYLFILIFFAPVLAAEEHEIMLCGDDISDRASPYQWQNIEPDVPLYFYDGDAEKIYQRLLEAYIQNLAPEDGQRGEVVQFIEMQKAIIDKKSSAFLSMKPGIIEGVELTSDNRSIPVNCADADQAYLIDMRYLSIAYRKIHDISNQVLREAANQTIQSINRQYQNWFDNGLPMWPQETWFNGLFLGESDAEEPAQYQWVVLRPSIGLGVNQGEGLSEDNVDEALGIEIGGFVRYLEEDYSSYWGLSLLATLGEDAGTGYGLLFRYNDYVLGYTRRDEDIALGIGSDNEYLYIGYDLYKLVHEKKAGYREYRQKIRDTISEYQ